MPKQLYLTVTSSLDQGEPFFILNSIEGEEKISGDFRYTLSMISREEADLKKLVGGRLSVAIRFPGDDGNESVTHINGIVIKASGRGRLYDAKGRSVWDYRCEIGSFLSALDLTQDYRIFQESGQTVISIITKLFKDSQFDNIKDNTKRPYSEVPFCVQYDESATNFFERLMEREGIGYYFTHQPTGHTLVLEDDFDAAPFCEGSKTFHACDSKTWHRSSDIVELRDDSEVTISKYTVNDYTFENAPNVDGTAVIDGGMGALKAVSYPSGVPTFKSMERRKRDLKNAEAIFQHMISGRSHARSMRAGHKFIVDAPDDPKKHDQEYVVYSVQLKASQRDFSNTFRAFPAIVTYRPKIDVRKKPKIHGYQTAVVVGDGSAETNVDKYGSVRVHFHWDLENGQTDANSSCYIRYSTIYAGGNRGFQFPPYIGDEVVVAFENGDPDRPLAIGSVFGPGHAVPNTVRNHPRRSTIKTSEDRDSNQLMFEDKPGEESFNIIAKKDYTRKVQNQEVDHIQDNRQTFIQKGAPAPDDSIQDHLVVEGNRKVMIKKGDSLEEHINEGEFKHTVTKDSTISIGKNFVLSVDGDNLQIEAVGKGGGNLILRGKTVTLESTDGDIAMKAAKNFAGEVGKDYNLKISGGLKEEVTKDRIFKISGGVKIDSGKDLKIKSGAAVVMESGADFKCKAAMAFKIEGGTDFAAKGGMSAKVEGGVGVTVKGAIVKVN